MFYIQGFASKKLYPSVLHVSVARLLGSSLTVASPRVTLGDRAFPVAAARAWNSHASTDQGRFVAAVFSTADKGPSVSAVVQLASDYCHRFFKSDM